MPLAFANLAANGPNLPALQARSSVGERFLDTEEAGGSIPPVPTIFYFADRWTVIHVTFAGGKPSTFVPAQGRSSSLRPPAPRI